MSDFFGDTNFDKWKAWPLHAVTTSGLTPMELGAMSAAFSERFSYELVVRRYMDNNMRGQYRLFVVNRESCYSRTEFDSKEERDCKLPRIDEARMIEWIRGFTEGLEKRSQLRLKVKRRSY